MRLSQGGDMGELGELSDCAEPFAESAQPGVAADGTHNRYQERPSQSCVLEPPSDDEGVEQSDIVPGNGENGEQVLPTALDRHHGDQDGRWAERLEQRVTAEAVLGEGHGLADRPALVAKPCEHPAPSETDAQS